MNRRPGWLRALYESGELARQAATASSWPDLARRLGCTYNALRKARDSERRAGLDLLELVQVGQAPTEPVPARWPSVEAFDRAELEPLATIPERHAVRGLSTLVDASGAVVQQWIKTSPHYDDRADWLRAIRDMGGELSRADAVVAPEHHADDLCVVLPVGDPHVGLLAWHEDSGGENFDLDIAERRYVAAFDHLLDLAPAAAECLIVFIGDTAHADSQSNTTTRGTRVDVDGRIVEVARTILRICRHAIGLALRRHQRVTVILERGNHDELISALLALALAQHYEHEPRVVVDQSPAAYHWYRFGNVLIGTHHGDKARPEQLAAIMAVDRPHDWAACSTRRWYLGHYHHAIVKEVPGVVVEYLPTLASSDAWHAAMGYRSAKALYLDVFHAEHGHINRHIVGLGQVRARGGR